MTDSLQGTEVYNNEPSMLKEVVVRRNKGFSSTAKVITADAARELQNSHQLPLVFHPSGQGH